MTMQKVVEALQPFAQAADPYGDKSRDGDEAIGLTMRDLRRAREALAFLQSIPEGDYAALIAELHERDVRSLGGAEVWRTSYDPIYGRAQTAINRLLLALADRQKAVEEAAPAAAGVSWPKGTETTVEERAAWLIRADDAGRLSRDLDHLLSAARAEKEEAFTFIETLANSASDPPNEAAIFAQISKDGLDAADAELQIGGARTQWNLALAARTFLARARGDSNG